MQYGTQVRYLLDDYLHNQFRSITVDVNGNTAADIALSLNNEQCYQIVRNAGIRSEFLLHLLRSRDESPSNMKLEALDTSAAGSTETFLKTPLRYVTDPSGQQMVLAKTDDGSEVGVMMGWEHGISSSVHDFRLRSYLLPAQVKCTVDKLLKRLERTNEGINILNVGFGLGIVNISDIQS